MTTSEPAIGDYGIIGDCRSAALISKDGALDWLCWPNFGSDPVFAKLLDPEHGGTWSIKPRGRYTRSRRYIGKTNVLETRFETESGSVTLTDFMPVASERHQRQHHIAERQITRMLHCEQGAVELIVRYSPTLDFGQARPAIDDRAGFGLRSYLRGGMVTLHGGLRWTIAGGEATAELCLKQGEDRAFMLTYSSEGLAILPLAEAVASDFERTRAWWESWSEQFSYRGAHADAVQRSVLTLKLLQFAPTGAFVAAATTSLPESVGAALNYDYRFCWLRDASFNLQALHGTGYAAEAETFLEWMLRATRLTQPKLMTCYDMFGNPVPKEKALDGVAGYRGSTPVRVGNMAGAQHQLDTYGEVICGAARLFRDDAKPDAETQKVLIKFGSFVAKHWQDPDAGIWESRDEPSVHTHSRLLCWVAMEELLKMHTRGIIEKLPVDLFQRTRQTIRENLEQTCWREDLMSYTSAPETTGIDATLLLFAVHNFAASDSHRLQATYRKVVEVLRTGDSLLLRNLTKPTEPQQGAFGICGFWEVEFLAMGGGTLEAAETHFEGLLRYANDLGLYAEEIDPLTGQAVGNFPQTFTHVGLVNAALAIEKRKKRSSEATTCTT